MPSLTLHTILRLPREARPAAAREWLRKEEARFPEASRTTSVLPEGTNRHPLDLILKLPPQERPPAVRTWLEREEPEAIAELETQAQAAAHNHTLPRYPSAWVKYPDFQPPAEPWIELFPNGDRLYHSPYGSTCPIPKEEPQPDSSPEIEDTVTVSSEDDNTIQIVSAPPEEVAEATEDHAGSEIPRPPHLNRFPPLPCELLIDESPAPPRKPIHQQESRGPPRRGPPIQCLSASVPQCLSASVPQCLSAKS